MRDAREHAEYSLIFQVTAGIGPVETMQACLRERTEPSACTLQGHRSTRHSVILT